MTPLPLALLLALAAPPAAAPVSADDPHSLANPQQVRPRHLSLDLRLRFPDKAIAGVAELALLYPGAAPRHLDLDTRDLHIEKVTEAPSGRALAFTLEPAVPMLGRRLRIELPRPAPRRVRIAYTTSPGASALQWLDPAQTTSGRLPFLFTQSQAIHARSWIPCMDSPGVRMTYDAVVRVPAGMKAVMSAAHLRHDEAKGIFRFRMRQPIPSYLIALAAGEIAFAPLSPRAGVYAEPDVLKKAAWEFTDVEKMMRVAERLYGPYRWGRWDTIVLPPSFPYGGMENPRLTFATPTIIAGDRSLVNVLAHELAHSWSGNLVTNATWSDFWLNEGFTSYIENRITEELYGREVAELEVLLGQRQIHELLADPKTKPEDTRLRLSLAGRDPDDIPGPIAYEKGANFLRMLEHRFGRARFDAFLRRYFDAHAFQSMTTERFLAILKRDLFRGREAAWKEAAVEAWMDAPGVPAGMVVPSSARYERTRAAAEAFARSGSLEGVRPDWVTHEWLGFLEALPRSLTQEQMAELDRRFRCTQSGNAEVLFAWLMHAVRNTYEPAFPALEAFLTRVGRRKFLRPLYQAMNDNERTRELARRIYAKARPGYHPIATASIDAILNPPSN